VHQPNNEECGNHFFLQNLKDMANRETWKTFVVDKKKKITD